MPNYTRVFVENSYVFITVTINNRSRNLLTDYIDEFRLALKATKRKVRFEIYAMAVMPEHFHMIIKPDLIDEFPKIISLIKIHFSKYLPEKLRLELSQEISSSKINKRESGVWQRRFYEHTIRDMKELNHLTDYIHFNPVKHGHVEKPCDWPYSSFLKFVTAGFYAKDWCDFVQQSEYH